MNVNERLAEYVTETVVVSNLDTSIIPYEKWKKLICDMELLRAINLT